MDSCSSNNISSITNILLKLRDSRVLNRIYDNVFWYKLFKIIKYNKKLNKYLDLDNNLSPIIIEVIPYEDREGIFINIFKEEEKFIHVYFDDDPNEYKTNYLDKNHHIKKIKIIIDPSMKECTYLFYKCLVIKSITFIQFKRHNIYYMNYMFARCYNLQNIEFNEFNTDVVLSMKLMFYKCYNLKILDLKKFNMKNVLDYSGMFYKCENLTDINVDYFYFENAVNTEFMFAYCYSLKHVYLGILDLHNIESKLYMFYDCGDEDFFDHLLRRNPNLPINTYYYDQFIYSNIDIII